MMLEQLLSDHFAVIALRIFIALLLSGLIGFERELNNQSAGFRTHILVGIGACLMMLLSIYGFDWVIDKYENVRFNPARIPSYVISGIGFLGAGTIIVHGGTIRGLTTAASIWTVAGLGLVVGMGMYGTAVYTTMLILLSLALLNKFEKTFVKDKRSRTLEIYAGESVRINQLVSVMEQYNLTIKKVDIVNETNNTQQILVKYDRKSDTDTVTLMHEISQIEHIRTVNERN